MMYITTDHCNVAVELQLYFEQIQLYPRGQL